MQQARCWFCIKAKPCSGMTERRLHFLAKVQKVEQHPGRKFGT
jgi:hypothetical protein